MAQSRRQERFFTPAVKAGTELKPRASRADRSHTPVGFMLQKARSFKQAGPQGSSGRLFLPVPRRLCQRHPAPTFPLGVPTRH